MDAAAAGSTIVQHALYIITDEDRLAIGIGAGSYTAFLKEGEGGGAPANILATPENTSPAHGAVDVALTPTLTASAYFSTIGSLHAKTRVQLSASSDFAAPLYDSGELAATTSFTLGAGVVQFGQTYFWRMAYKDVLGQWSEWSRPTSFDAIAVSVVTQPTNTLPANGATDTQRSQALTASAFASTQGAAHQATRVQVSSSASFASPRLDVTLGAVASYKIPKSDWQLGATDYWRVQYQNDLGIWSEWSDATVYTTSIFAVDATGGVITQDGAYNVHTFAAGGIFELSEDVEADVLVVGGGGGGAGEVGGGGGGGGVIYRPNQTLAAGTYAVVVGDGGAGAVAATGANGSNSSFSTLPTAIGGGGGGCWFVSAPRTGGSGGGSGRNAHAGAAGTAGQGYSGGTGSVNSGAGGGGGGASGNSPIGSTSGIGGAGFACAISPAATHYAGGGGGAGNQGTGTIGGAGGIGGGGNADTSGAGYGLPGAANTGGGGGGGGYDGISYSGGKGGKGIVIVRYLR